MAIEQAGDSQSEVKNLDSVTSDAKAAYDSVMNTPAETPVTEAATEKPAEVKIEIKTDDRLRDEQGRFAPKVEAKDELKTTDKPIEAKPVTTDKPIEAKPAAEQLQPKNFQGYAAAPPTSWAIKAKAEWDKLSPTVREAIATREAEVSAGFAGYQGLKPFIEAVKQRGQDPGQVIQSFMGIEQTLRSDPRAGFLHIANNLGLTQHQAAQFFAGIATDLGYAPSNGQAAPANQNGFGGSPADQNAVADPALHQQLDPMIRPLQQELAQLKQYFVQQTEAQRSQRLQSATTVIEKFRSDPKNRYYDNLEADIGKILEAGIVERTGDLAADLAAAYDVAAWKHADTRALLIKEQAEKNAADQARIAKEAADKARQASRSVTGSPSPGAGIPASKRDSKLSYDEDLQNDVMDAVRSVAARA